MSETSRKLATIVALDVAGYSARTEADEAKTVAQIALLRPVIEGIAKTHGGRVFNTAGDGFMLEFASALSGVNAALELADECRPRVRVGVHVGEVIAQPNGDLLGHGVNVAARLMAKAEPGTALISGDVCRMIRGPLAERFVSRGPVQLDKMNETIEVFAPVAGAAHLAKAPQKPKASARAFPWPQWFTPRIAAMAGVPVLLVGLALLLWGRSSSPAPSGDASVAVLPFENLSTDKDNAFFAAGIQDEILTRLSKIGALKVISRTSTAKYASHPDNLKEIAEALGVSNILEGSVQRSGDKVRVNVQLIRAATDDHLWAEIYDRKVEDIFTVQSEISTAIAQALKAKLSGAEQQQLASRPTNNLEAYEAYLKASKLYKEALSFEDFPKIETLLKKAVALDPQFASAWALLSVIQSQLHNRQLFTLPAVGNKTQFDVEARASLHEAERLQPDLLEVRFAKAYYVYRVQRDYDTARRLYEDLRANWPGNTQVLSLLGYIAKRQGRWADCIDYLSQVSSLDPLSATGKAELSEVQYSTRRYQDALRSIDEAAALDPGNMEIRKRRIYVLQALGRLDDAARDLAAAGQPLPKALKDAFVNQALMTREYGPAIDLLLADIKATPAAEANTQDHAMRRRSQLGALLKFSGRESEAREHNLFVRNFTAAVLKEQPDKPNSLIGNAWASALLGDRERALKSIDRAVELWPIASDAATGAAMEANRATIWAMLGDPRAIPELERITKKEAGDILLEELRRQPYYDKLRGDPRFEALLK